jgi:hypothetical protein
VAIVVALTDGKLRLHEPDGKSRDVDRYFGEAAYSASTAQRIHATENIGPSDFRAVRIEIKTR